MQKIVIENSIYSILIFIMIEKKWKQSIFILNDKFNINFIKNLKNKVNYVYIYKMEKFIKNPMKYYREQIKLYFYLYKNKVLFEKKIKIYGNDDLDYFLLKNRNIFLLEDGLYSYCHKKKNTIRKILKFKSPFYKSFGSSKYVKKIYLTGISSVPREIEKKVEIINLKNLWNMKSDREKKEILELFEFSNEKIEYLKNKKNILFTQPLSEDGAITEKEKIDLYSKIIRKYDNEKLVIKKHPREKTDYKEIFNNILVIEESFPAEILDFLDIKFEKIITIFSTAALNLSQDINIDFYGTEVEDKLLRYFGSFENIMKRNSYL